MVDAVINEPEYFIKFSPDCLQLKPAAILAYKQIFAQAFSFKNQHNNVY